MPLGQARAAASVQLRSNCFSRSIYASANYTIYATGLSVLWCPSDPSIQEVVQYPFYEPPLTPSIRFTSYAGCTGVFDPEPWVYPDPLNPDRIEQMNGLFITQRSIRVADIKDGLSQTMLMGERAHGLITGEERTYWHWWADSTASDTRFWTIFPMNPFRKIPDTPEAVSSAWNSSASSFHPNGAQFAFADGSVKFIKDSIDSWKTDPSTGYPIGVSQDSNGFFHISTQTIFGVYQKLSTRSGSEVVSASSY